MTFADIIFVLIVLFTAASALMTALARPIIHALLGLVATMFGIAGLYVYLNAPFVAMMQILIYVGAISIIIAFAIMLLGPLVKSPHEWKGFMKYLVALAAAVVSITVFVKVIGSSYLSLKTLSDFTLTAKDIGRAFYERYMLPFELISLLISVAIIGAIMLVLFSKEEK